MIDINLSSLESVKTDIKDAIELCEVDVEGGLTTYADAINDIILAKDDTPMYFPPNTRFAFSNFSKFPECIVLENYTNTHRMFEKCRNLITAPFFDTSKVTNMSYMFYECREDWESIYDDFNKLRVIDNIPLYDCGNVENISYMFHEDYGVTNVAGFKNLGEKPNLTGTTTAFDSMNMLTKESILNILNNLYDRAKDGYSILTIEFSSELQSKFDDSMFAIAVDKGWTIAFD